MLKDLLESVPLSKGTCAQILGVAPAVFDEWVAGQAAMPAGYARALAGILGVAPEALRQRQVSAAEATPSIWFRLRDHRVGERERTQVALLRRFAHLVDQFEAATGSRSFVWKSVFDTVSREVDFSASPLQQGRHAAQILRAERGLKQGATGIASAFRGHLRALGVLVVESPLPDSKIEGCSFYVQSADGVGLRPCVFANTHGSTWFRRNYVLFHETAHLIFDALKAGASVDFSEVEPRGAEDVIEQRADAFAQDMLVPPVVLRHLAQANGIDWERFTPEALAALVADTEVEAGLVLKAAAEAQLLSKDQRAEASGFDIATLLRARTERALSAPEYFRRHPEREHELGKRATATSPPLRLPAGYVGAVVEAVNEGVIAASKGAELLMIDRRVFHARFGAPSSDD